MNQFDLLNILSNYHQYKWVPISHKILSGFGTKIDNIYLAILSSSDLKFKNYFIEYRNTRLINGDSYYVGDMNLSQYDQPSVTLFTVAEGITDYLNNKEKAIVGV